MYKNNHHHSFLPVIHISSFFPPTWILLLPSKNIISRDWSTHTSFQVCNHWQGGLGAWAGSQSLLLSLPHIIQNESCYTYIMLPKPRDQRQIWSIPRTCQRLPWDQLFGGYPCEGGNCLE